MIVAVVASWTLRLLWLADESRRCFVCDPAALPREETFVVPEDGDLTCTGAVIVEAKVVVAVDGSGDPSEEECETDVVGAARGTELG